MSGLFAAVGLQSLGHEIHVFERTTRTRQGAGITVTTPLIPYLKELNLIPQNLEEKLKKDASLSLDPKNTDYSWIYQSTKTYTVWDDNKIFLREHSDSPRLHTSWDALYSILKNALSNTSGDDGDHNFHYYEGMQYLDVDTKKEGGMMTIHLLNAEKGEKETFNCDLLVGCDGIGGALFFFFFCLVFSENKIWTFNYRGLQQNEVWYCGKLYGRRTSFSSFLRWLSRMEGDGKDERYTFRIKERIGRDLRG